MPYVHHPPFRLVLTRVTVEVCANFISQQPIFTFFISLQPIFVKQTHYLAMLALLLGCFPSTAQLDAA
jgi:hypothetical protein